MAATGNEAVTISQLKTWGDEKLSGGGATCELTLSGDGTASAAFTYQGLDGTFSYEALMDGSKHERVTTVPVGSVVKVSYGNEPGVRVSASFADLVSDGGTATRSVDFYLVNSTSASIAVKGMSVAVPDGPASAE